MPGASAVAVFNTLTPGVETRFVSNYNRTYQGMAAKMGQVMDLSVPSGGAYEIYPYFESASTGTSALRSTRTT